MIEIEAKVKIENPARWRKKIARIARFIKKEKKQDDYYTLEPLTRYPKKSLRVRTHGKNYELNFKERLSYKNGIDTKKEHEYTFPQKNLAAIKEQLSVKGFKHWLRKEKISEIYEIEKNIHIELNNVKQLGFFLEIEYLGGEKDIAHARKKLTSIMKKLNIKKSQIIQEGYTKLLWDKKITLGKK